MADTEEVDLKTPSGETVTVRVPSGWSDNQIKANLRAKNPELFAQSQDAMQQTMKASRTAAMTELQNQVKPGGSVSNFQNKTGEDIKDHLAAAMMANPLTAVPAAMWRPGVAGNAIVGGVKDLGRSIAGLASMAVPQTPGEKAMLLSGPGYGAVIGKHMGQAMNDAQQQSFQRGFEASDKGQTAKAAINFGTGIPGPPQMASGVYEANENGAPGEGVGVGASRLGQMAVAQYPKETLGAIRAMNPFDTKAAAALLQSTDNVAHSVPVDPNLAGDFATDVVKMRTLQARGGGTMPAPARAMLLRMQSGAPMTFGELRDFYSAATKLSASDKMAMGGQMPAAFAQYTSKLGAAIQNIADRVGKGEDFSQGMKGYARAKTFQRGAATAGKAAVTAIPHAGAAALAYKILKP